MTTNTRFLLVTFSLLLSFNSCQLKPKKKTYKFSEKPVVEWSDFTGTIPDGADDIDAALYYGMEYEHWDKSVNGYLVLDMKAFSYFECDSSWTRGYDDADFTLIQHEEVHLLIAELHARIFKKSLVGYPFSLNYRKEIEGQFDLAIEAMFLMQTLYDEETDHSLIRDEQKRWEYMIHDSLISLSDYRKERYRIETNFRITQEELELLPNNFHP